MSDNRYAVLKDDEVCNIILLDEADEYAAPDGCLVRVAPDEVEIGWTFTNNTWSGPEEIYLLPTPVEDPAVLEAKEAALTELMDIGVSEQTARTIIGLPLGT